MNIPVKQQALDNIPGAIQQFLNDGCYTMVGVNHGFLEMFGFSEEELLSRFHGHFIEMLHEADRPTFQEMVEAQVKHSGKSLFRCRILCKDGSYKWMLCSILAALNQEGRVQITSIMLNVHKEMQTREKLLQRADRDALTGLYNRDVFERKIAACLNRHPDTMHALLMIDTDNFKQVNDTMGHLFGDAVLSEMAMGMKKLTGPADYVGRIGGDEFAVFYHDIGSKAAAGEKAAQLLEMFRQLFQNEKTQMDVTCSIGIGIFPDNGEDFRALYRSADLALYQAKTQGKNRYVLFDEGDVIQVAQAKESSLGTLIDSNIGAAGGLDNLASYVFQILYTSHNLSHAVQMILEIVGKRFDVSRAYVFENSEDGQYCDNTYEWCNTGIPPQKDLLQHFWYGDILEYHTLFNSDAIFYCRDISSLTPEQMELFKSQGVRSTLQCAIRNGETFCGFVGFDECTGLRMWTKEEVAMLTLISQLLTTFLLAKRISERDHALMLRLNTILDAQDAFIYAIAKDTYELLYINQKTRKLDPLARTGMTCHQAFFDRDTPCIKCPLLGKNGEIYNPKYHVWTRVRAASMQWDETDAYLLTCFDITEYMP